MGFTIDVIRAVATAMTLLIIARALLSWVNPSPNNPVVRWILRLTDPIMGPIQSLLPAPGGIDFSPIVAIFIVKGVEYLLVNLVYNLS